MRKDQKKKNGQVSRLISTSKLHALLHFHTWPINVVVFNKPPEDSYLGSGLILVLKKSLSRSLGTLLAYVFMAL